VRFRGVRRILLLMLAAGALPAPAAATAQPPPADPAAPALVGRPYLVRADGGRLTLYLRLAQPIGPRFDGEIPATAEIDGRRSSLSAVRGARPAAACYSAAVVPAGDPAPRLGSRHEIALVLDGEAAPRITSRARLRPPRDGDARGLALGC
jgi:hypothetical protein